MRPSAIFAFSVRGSPLTINDMLHHFHRNISDLHNGIPLEGTKVRRNINIPRGVLHVLTKYGPRKLYSLALGFDFYVERSEAPITGTRRFVYSDIEEPLVYGYEGRIAFLERPITVSAR